MCMKNCKLILTLFLAGLSFSSAVYAGNEDRAGEAGASQLLINPWVRSVGFGGANSSSAIGLESINLNVAGLAFTRQTEVMFVNKNWLVGSGTRINSFGLSQRLSETSVFAVSIASAFVSAVSNAF